LMVRDLRANRKGDESNKVFRVWTEDPT
jgi:hypothetical protein